ncbi:uncharacterized protein LOC131544819 [Onychostoma macrolepis]|uniref:uncharacterized protein LOC131544819 n=1 Tax=Onychostoma macrolepis TaxID=369639 RepID=UPI00272C2CD6|nr:uncharacterized protein LOC131544819 [Onychostoma macrolepis]
MASRGGGKLQLQSHTPRSNAPCHPVWRFHLLSPQQNSILKSNLKKILERLSDILTSYLSAEPQKSSASSWSFRQQKASERWKEARPYHLKCLIATEAVGQPLCWLCHEPAVIRCRECLPEEWFCGDCDVLHHKKQPLHNRECVIHGFSEAIPPTSCVIKGRDGYCIHEQACILPTVKAPDCSCEGTNFTILPGKPVILITINGRFDLHQPLRVCQTCQHQWTPDLKDLLRSGYWPASDTSSTLYTLDLLNSFQDLKVISPGFSRQAFAKLLEHRTKIGGRSGQINGDTLQRSFLEFMLHLRKTSSAVVLLSPAQPARQKCWLFQPMETESYIAFAETQALMILPFLRGSLWLKTLRCLDLWKPYRKQ